MSLFGCKQLILPWNSHYYSLSSFPLSQSYGRAGTVFPPEEDRPTGGARKYPIFISNYFWDGVLAFYPCICYTQATSKRSSKFIFKHTHD